MFETTELSVASYLAYSMDTLPEAVWNQRARKVAFVFPDADKCITLLGIYQAGEARVEPREFWHTCNDVRHTMHSVKSKSGR